MTDAVGPGAPGLSFVLHTVSPRTEATVQLILCLALAVIAFVIADVISKGRFREISLILARMVSALAPLMALCAAAHAFLSAGLGAGLSSAPVAIQPVVESAFVLVVGAAVGGLGVILTGVLRLFDALSRRRNAYLQPLSRSGSLNASDQRPDSPS